MGRVSPDAVETKSPMEVDFLALCREAGFPSPAVNVWVEGRLVDFHWPKEKVVVETDGYTFHAGRPAFEQDHFSTVALELAGYRVHRATREMLESEPGPFLSLVRKSLSAHV
jgi:very-short-patch-repair endonuclease